VVTRAGVDDLEDLDATPLGCKLSSVSDETSLVGQTKFLGHPMVSSVRSDPPPDVCQNIYVFLSRRER
jgi:hypothetical protein